jgi:uncharacterized protein with FMN-binding domain
MTPKRLPSGKIPLAIALVIFSSIYAAWQALFGSEQPIAPIITTASSTPSSPSTSSVSPQEGSATSTTPSPQNSGQYKNGTYTGTPADAFYGIVQVQAIIQNGKLAGVKFLQYPGDRDTSIAVNTQAMPILIQEAIVAQSATVDTASGATFTSEAFRESLASALALAK